MSQGPAPFVSPTSYIPQDLRNQFSGPPAPIAAPIAAPIMQQPNGGKSAKALRTFVNMTGVTNLPEAESIKLQGVMGKLSECLMQLSELQHDLSMPNNVRGERLFDIMPIVNSCLADVLQLGGFELGTLQGGYLEEGIAKHKHAFELKQHLSNLYIQPASPDLCVKSSDDIRVISSLVLGVIENVMEVFGISDRETTDRIKEMVENVKKTVLEICEEFIMGKDSAQAAQYIATNGEAVSKLVELSNRYSMFMTDVLRAFIARLPFLPNEIIRNELNGIIVSLRDLTPKLILIASGKLAEPGVVDRLLGAVDEGNELVKMVPRFSARVEMEFVGGGSLDMASASLKNSVCSLAVEDIGAKARAYAVQVTDVISQCRQIGINSVDCDEVQRALAGVVKLAKVAVTSGQAEDARKFELAVEDVNKLVAALPTKFKLVFYEESSNALDAAKELLDTGLLDFVESLQ